MGVEPNILRLWASDDSGLYCFISPIRFTHPQWEQQDSNLRPLSCKGSATKPTELYSQFSPKVNTILSVILTHWVCNFVLCHSRHIHDPSVLLYVALYLDYRRPPYTYSSRHLTVASLHCSNLQGLPHCEAANRISTYSYRESNPNPRTENPVA